MPYIGQPEGNQIGPTPVPLLGVQVTGCAQQFTPEPRVVPVPDPQSRDRVPRVALNLGKTHRCEHAATLDGQAQAQRACKRITPCELPDIGHQTRDEHLRRCQPVRVRRTIGHTGTRIRSRYRPGQPCKLDQQTGYVGQEQPAFSRQTGNGLGDANRQTLQ